MEGLEKEGKEFVAEKKPEEEIENSKERVSNETEEEEKPAAKRKSFFDKFTERFKEFLDNAE